MPNFHVTDPEYWQVPATRAGTADKLADTLGAVNLSYFLLGADAPDTPRVLIMDMGPGFVIPRHMHGCERFEIIVKGSLHYGDDVFTQGDVLTAHANELYGPKIAGADGCLTAEFFVTQEDSVPIFELDDGSLYKSSPGEGPPPNIAQQEWIETRRAEILGAEVPVSG